MAKLFHNHLTMKGSINTLNNHMENLKRKYLLNRLTHSMRSQYQRICLHLPNWVISPYTASLLILYYAKSKQPNQAPKTHYRQKSMDENMPFFIHKNHKTFLIQMKINTKNFKQTSNACILSLSKLELMLSNLISTIFILFCIKIPI